VAFSTSKIHHEVPAMPVNFLNLPGLDVVDFRETAIEYHVRAKPKAVSRQCPSYGPAGKQGELTCPPY